MDNANIKAELVDVFTQQIDSTVRRIFEALIEEFGATMRGVANSKRYRVWTETVKPCCEAARISNRETFYALSEERLAGFSRALADEQADEVLAKVNEKVGAMEESKVHHAGCAHFNITGSKNGRQVRIVQHQIVNVSVKGKLFNQHPSRIYVDDKLTSAAKFAAL